MKHPFAGIIFPQTSVANEIQSPAPDRRTALLALAGAAVTLAAAPGLAQPPDARRGDRYALYLVIPRKLKEFTDQRRRELSVLGPYKGRWTENHKFQEDQGYFAWLNDAQAARLRGNPAVAHLRDYDPAAVVEYGQPKPGANHLSIYTSPNTWAEKPPQETYASSEDLVSQWSTLAPDAKVELNAATGAIDIHFPAAPNEALLQAIHENPQTHMLAWGEEAAPAPAEATTAVGEEGSPPLATRLYSEGGGTTLRLGEEGGRVPSTRALGEEGGATTYATGEEGGATTYALGEEGATTKGLGEEGGVATTYALGEEGGSAPSTRMSGEEGGVTTYALGEEGGPPPSTTTLGEEGGPPPSTTALGEEGGGVTTLALGEEGGAAPPQPAPTTQALGEEGGPAPRIERAPGAGSSAASRS